jgi:hypothetical protein
MKKISKIMELINKFANAACTKKDKILREKKQLHDFFPSTVKRHSP